MLHASYLHEKQRNVEAVAYLSQLEIIYEEKGLWTARLRHYILKAICYMALRSNEDAVREFSVAYEMTNQNRIITPFIEHGSEMVRLIEIAKADTTRRFRREWMDAVLSKSSAFASHHTHMLHKHRAANKTPPHNHVSLSKRERDVLRLIAEGLTREEMGKRLNLSVNSIKRYISGLYNKLGAVNRADAIRIAITRGDLSVNGETG